MTGCNYCLYKSTQKLAHQIEERSGKKQIVETVAHPIEGFPNGVDIFMHGEGEPVDSGLVAWVAELPEGCECGQRG